MNDNNHTVDLTLLQVLNLETLVENRITETDELAVKFPHLPMKDPYTYDSYVDLLAKLKATH